MKEKVANIQKYYLKSSKWFDANIDPIKSLNYLMKMNFTLLFLFIKDFSYLKTKSSY